MLQALGETFLTLVVIMDPIGAVPIFIAATAPLPPADRKRAALRAVVFAGILVLGFALVGRLVLDYLHVSVEALSISGGLLLLLVALEMLRGIDSAPTGSEEDVALVPLATPLVAGPGAIATVIVLNEQHRGADRIGVLAGIVAALLVVGASLLVAEWLGRVLPKSLISFLTRVFGLLLSAIAVQLVVDGVRGLS